MTLLQPLHSWKTLAEVPSIFAATPDQARDNWAHIGFQLERSCKRSRGRDTVADCFDDIQSGHAVLWIIIEDGLDVAFGITEIQTRTNGKVCVIRQMAGDAMRHWLPTIETIKEFGRINGCNRVEFEGRDGWGKVVPNVDRVGSIYEVKI